MSDPTAPLLLMIKTRVLKRNREDESIFIARYKVGGWVFVPQLCACEMENEFGIKLFLLCLIPRRWKSETR